MADINVGQLAEVINDKMDRDANNIESPKLPVFLVDVQYPTAENNYTWYRKYSDGWVEQGGRLNTDVSSQTITMSVEMADTTYSIMLSIGKWSGSGTGGYAEMHAWGTRTTTNFHVDTRAGSDVTGQWEVRGMAAQ